MKIESVVYLINRFSNENNYPRARLLINKEWNRISEYKNYELLNTNAKQLLKIIKDEKENGSQNELSQSEKNILNLVNQSIRDLRLPYAKRIFIEHNRLFDKPEAIQWLTSDAKFICNSWRQSE
jgi:hypothetical protein